MANLTLGPTFLSRSNTCHFPHISLANTSHIATLNSEGVGTCNPYNLPAGGRNSRNTRTALMTTRLKIIPLLPYASPEKRNIKNIEFGDGAI